MLEVRSTRMRPLQPGPRISRESAQFPRAIQSEKLSPANRALLTAVTQELAATESFIPEERPHHSPKDPLTVVVASSNMIKEAELRKLLEPHKVTVYREPKAIEHHTRDSYIDAKDKAESAAQIFSERAVRRKIRTSFVSIGADTLNSIPIASINDTTGAVEFSFQRFGKPSNLRNRANHHLTRKRQEKSIQDMFAQLSKLVETYNLDFVPYLTEVTTIIHDPNNPQRNAVSTRKSAVLLTREALSVLASNDGFEAYKREAARQGVDITKTAGGFAIETLTRLRYVASISGQPEELAYLRAERTAQGHADHRLITAYFGTEQAMA